MPKHIDHSEFQPINRGYNTAFHQNRLSLGVVVPLETYATGPVPSMTRHVERVQLAEELGFQLGADHLRAYLKSLEEIGINHVALNLRINQADIETTLKCLAEQLLPDFSGPDFTN